MADQSKEAQAEASDKEETGEETEFDPCCYQVNRQDLAQKVYALLQQEMRIEIERLGRRYHS